MGNKGFIYLYTTFRVCRNEWLQDVDSNFKRFGIGKWKDWLIKVLIGK